MESPFQAILYTNAVPTDADCTRILNLLVRQRQQVTALNQRIDETTRLLDELTRKRDELGEYIDAHLALTSPARKLPEDVVRAIFTACLPTSHNAVMSVHESPLLLCRICSAWRRVALSTPRLWASLHIVVPPAGTRRIEPAQAVRSWISRSGAVPLSLSLTLAKAVYDDRRIKTILGVLGSFSSRWKTVRFLILSYSDFATLSHLTADDVPLLESFSIDARATPPELHSPSPWVAFSLLTGSSLRRVSISSGYRFHDLNLSWGVLSDLSIARWPLSPTEFLAVLGKCRGLETCHVLVATGPPISVLPPVTLSNLHHFSLVDATDTASDLFTKLDFPDLRSLRYWGKSLPRELPAFPSLRSLTLEMSAVSSKNIIEYLTRMSQVRDLKLAFEPLRPPEEADDGWGFPDPTFLAQLNTASPSLQRLRLDRMYAASDDDLLTFILARTGGAIAALTHISVVFMREMERDIGTSLQPLLSQGLSLSVQYQPPSLPLMVPYSPRDDLHEVESPLDWWDHDFVNSLEVCWTVPGYPSNWRLN
ncbi:hypothetical protein C8R46DRAFT_980547 [Mycena filopes]|nr:hypothetical protein C8R46DRAFT_980547 [Mycena filopes]